MYDWLWSIGITAGFLLLFVLLLSRVQRRSKALMQENHQLMRERLQMDKEAIAVQKETNELLRQLLAKLDKKHERR